VTQEAACSTTRRGRHAVRAWLATYGTTVFLTVLFVFVVRWKVAQPFYIPSSSMEPTLHREDRILVSKVSYVLGKPARWDVAIFMEPRNHDRNFVKRIVGLPGETLQIIAGDIYINGRCVPKPKHLRGVFYTHEGVWGTSEPVRIPDDCYFVLGDNSSRSNDSRCWGRPFVRRSEIIGKAVSVIWPLSRARRIR